MLKIVYKIHSDIKQSELRELSEYLAPAEIMDSISSAFFEILIPMNTDEGLKRFTAKIECKKTQIRVTVSSKLLPPSPVF